MMRSQGLFTPRTFFRPDPILTKKERTTCASYGRVAQIQFWPRWPSDTLLTVKYFGDRQTVSTYVCPFWNSVQRCWWWSVNCDKYDVWRKLPSFVKFIEFLSYWWGFDSKFLRKRGSTIDANLLDFGEHSLNNVQCNFWHPPKIL